MPQDTLPFSHAVRRDEVPEGGLDLELVPSAAQRQALATFLSVPAVESLKASLHVTRHGKAGLRVRGHVAGEVVQTCVVTLEPVSEPIDEAIDTIYAPEGSPVLHVELTPEELASEESDLEPMVGGSIDVGGLVIEHVAIGLSPYPRKAGVEFEAVAEAGDEPKEPSPFSSLARLKDGETRE
ncbi:YceD family protein [Lutibaculum baratangense]|uniref:DUF177 domain-containing protein n=1 Tax=Lutibaculum baratangense AMV1 TaxID=631454 RepID=V4QU25_9HYPH|nr:DUF177 domain-containing protein [Lutibaculum baratangense]ESR23277.1 hypothetical protein N177_3345 [Lutibaculum baratangense AMV1]